MNPLAISVQVRDEECEDSYAAAFTDVTIIGEGIVALPVTEHKFGIPEPARMYVRAMIYDKYTNGNVVSGGVRRKVVALEHDDEGGFRKGIQEFEVLRMPSSRGVIGFYIALLVVASRQRHLRKVMGAKTMGAVPGVGPCSKSGQHPDKRHGLTDPRSPLLEQRRTIRTLNGLNPNHPSILRTESSSNMDHRQTISNSSPGSTAPRRSGIRMFGQNPSMDSTQIAGSQGSRSQPLSVEVTVLRARNVPQFKTTFGGKREYFVTITYGATTKKTKKQTKKRTKSAQIDGQIVAWDQRLDALYDFLIFDHIFRLKVPISLVQPSSHIILRLYAKKSITSDILVGTYEMTLPVESQINISVTLSDDNEQAGRSTPPVELDLTITVSANGTSPNDPHIIPTEGDDTAAEDFPKPIMAPDSSGLDRIKERRPMSRSLRLFALTKSRR
ncbi:hypothetical protein EDB92DRAFT_1820451 [Lactarius akahatsu]|uniref:C2 domain-containing protein n=1 Tax=Lactarius akahatsu TaxID=416441 RepID=A0AAD4Q8I9_9AGAM|nr:hypothetical protein EDB92DRAFT_1820451 [Lactarius akahatsu]